MSAQTVTVAANLPHGQTFVLANGTRVTLNGNAEALRWQEKGIVPQGAYGLTTLKAELWDAVKKEFGSMAIFSSGLVFTTNATADAEKEAQNRASLRHGLEPVDAEKSGGTSPATKEK